VTLRLGLVGSLQELFLLSFRMLHVGSVAQWLGWPFLAVDFPLTVPNLCLLFRQVTYLRINCPLWVSQLGQLSLPSLLGQ